MRQTSVCESLFQPADFFLQCAFLTPHPLKQVADGRIHTFKNPCLSLLEVLRALLDGRVTIRIGENAETTTCLPIS